MKYVVDGLEGESVIRHLRINAITELVVNVRRKTGAPVEGIIIFKRANAKKEVRETLDPATFERVMALCALFYVEIYHVEYDGTKVLTDTLMEWINVDKRR